MKFRVAICMFAVFAAVNAFGQVFAGGAWEQKNMFSVKASQLYCELSVGANLVPHKSTADFIYISYGYGKPTAKNAWRKFTPGNDLPENLPKALKEKLGSSGTDGLYAGMISAGWNHWFSHAVGCYVQAGWGFCADLSAGNDLTAEEKALLANAKDRRTFIYNTVPIELGLSLSMWQHYAVQAGVTYMWKEIPLFTFGLGYAF